IRDLIVTGVQTCALPILSDKGPVPDMARMLSGHPHDTHLPAPDLKPGPWSVATAGNTAWVGPWGITYSANLTPDTNTGLGIWTRSEERRVGKESRYEWSQ